MKLYLSHRKLSSLVGLVPYGVTILYCDHNQLTSFEGCPDSIIELRCSYNQLTSFKGCPKSVKILYCDRNKNLDLYLLPDSVKKFKHSSNFYKNMDLTKIREINKKRLLTTNFDRIIN